MKVKQAAPQDQRHIPDEREAKPLHLAVQGALLTYQFLMSPICLNARTVVLPSKSHFRPRGK